VEVALVLFTLVAVLALGVLVPTLVLVVPVLALREAVALLDPIAVRAAVVLLAARSLLDTSELALSLDPTAESLGPQPTIAAK
jgi:hypothetical protein